MAAEPSNRLHLVVPKRLFLSTRFQIRPTFARWLLLCIKLGLDLVKNTALQRKEPRRKEQPTVFDALSQLGRDLRLHDCLSPHLRCSQQQMTGFIDNITLLPWSSQQQYLLRFVPQKRGLL
jgi:hypothetical protein